jgi:hypothetical protein
MALAAGVDKGAFELATPSTVDRVCVIAWLLTFDGVTATNVPPACDWIRTTATGTGTGFTPLPVNTGVASVTTAKHSITTIGSMPTVYFPNYIPPTSGIYVQSPLGREEIEMLASQFWTLRINSPNIVNARGWVMFEE